MSGILQLLEAGSGQVIVPAVTLADRFWSRLCGLQFRRPLPPGSALLLTPCSSVHTFFMRFPVDLVMLDGGLHVLEVRRQVLPWRLVFPARATWAVLEMTAGCCPDVVPGTRLQLAPTQVGQK
jgi:uncharacterized protein